METSSKRAPASRAPRGGKTAKHRNTKTPTQDKKPASLPIKFQQSILDIFTQAFPIADRDYDTRAVIQEVKGHLFNRDFEAAFSRPDYLEVYAARWSAARALAYADIFAHEKRQNWFQPVSAGIQQSVSGATAPTLPGSVTCMNSWDDVNVTKSTTTPTTPLLHHGNDAIRVVSVGGGAGAEIVAFATLLLHNPVAHPIDILAIDVADWTIPIQHLSDAVTMSLQSVNQASQAVKGANTASIANESFSVTFLHADVLDSLLYTIHPSTPSIRSDEKQLGDPQSDNSSGNSHKAHNEVSQPESSPFLNADLVTIMFTLNELFSISLSKTTALLLHLTETLANGAHLIVVDSPGSYSEIKLGKAEVAKKYPMKWLLDHTLLNVAGKAKWTKLESEDSVWFRLDDRGKHLKYPIELENCRYQIHVYQKS